MSFCYKIDTVSIALKSILKIIASLPLQVDNHFTWKSSVLIINISEGQKR